MNDEKVSIMSGVKGVIESVTDKQDEIRIENLEKKVAATFAQTDAKYEGRAMHLFSLMTSLASLYDDVAQLEVMNYKKRGRPFTYTNGLMYAISTLRSAFKLDLRVCAGMAKIFLTSSRKHPSYTQIWRRINALDLSIKDGLSDFKLEDVTVTLIPDGTGLVPATRSEYVRVVHKLKRGFLRLVIIINLDTQEIISYSLTDDKTGESTVAEQVVENALRNLGIDPDERRIQVKREKGFKHKTYRQLELKADGGYDNRKFFSFCQKLGITPNIRVQTNSNTRANVVDRCRSEVVLEQLGGPDATPRELAKLTDDEREVNRKKWKKKVKYNLRWLVEIVISAFKRNYGDDVMAKNMAYINQEVKQKICTYNKMLRVGWEAASNI